jgi:acyl carrier protein
MTEDRTRAITAEVKEYILKEFLPGAEPDELDGTTGLVTGGVLDSISTVKLVSFLENRYGVEFRAHEMDAEHLDSLELIAATVASKLPR